MTKNLVRMAQQSMSGMAGTTGQQPGGTSQ